VEMAVVMGGIYWVIERREKLAAERAAEARADGGLASPGGGGGDSAVSRGDAGTSNGPEGSERAKRS